MKSLEEVRWPHVGVVTEHEKQDPSERHGYFVITDLGVSVRGVGLLHCGVHAGHELGCVLGLVVCLDVERLTDLRKDGIAVEGEVLRQTYDVELGRRS
jgi:hypothetical protein